MALSLMVSCGPDDASSSGWRVEEGAGDETDYGESKDVIITTGDGNDDVHIVTGSPNGEDDCVRVDEDTCVPLEDVKGRYCDDAGAQADVVVIDDVVVEVVCYPPPESGVSVEEALVSGDGTVQLPQNRSGAVITFDEATDGVPIEGDVRFDGERVTIFGNGVDETIFDGAMVVASNNSRIRGVTLTSDLTYEKNANNGALSFCSIHGSLTVNSNGISVLNCQVYGDLNIQGNDALLINVGVQGSWKVGSSTACDGCYSFDDANGDKLIADDERGDALSCPKAPGAL